MQPSNLPVVAYFSMEIALDQSIPTYSGGLGVLAGDTLRSASDLSAPLIGITLAHRKGYFRQRLDDNGNQSETAQEWSPERQLEPVDARGVSHHLRRDGERWQVREYVAHRSLYHLKEADPQAWVIPRLSGPAKAALVTVEHDEYGAGNPRRMHARLFADMMTELGLCAQYGAYLDAAPATTLAEINFMSMCGLHRKLRGALIGQFATVELTSSPGSDRLVRAMRRLGCGPAAIEFYAEHVEADAAHEQLIRHGVITPLLASEPELAADVVFGIQAANLLADRFSDLLLEKWATDQPTLRNPLPDAPS